MIEYRKGNILSAYDKGEITVLVHGCNTLGFMGAGIAKEITENIVTPGDYESLAEKIIFAIENYPSEKQKALSAREQIVSKYSLKRTTQDFVELYKSVTAFWKDSKVHG